MADFSAEDCNGIAKRFEVELGADKERCGGAQDEGVAAGEEMGRAVVADLLEDLKFAGLFAHDDEALFRGGWRGIFRRR